MATRGVNKVILIGNLGNKPEVRYTSNGNAITTISIATSENWKDKQTGELKEKTEWHRVVFFGKLAEISGELLKKGSQVYIEGQLQTRKWQDLNGNNKYITEVIVNTRGTMQILGNRNFNNNENINNKDNIKNNNEENNNIIDDLESIDDFDNDIQF